MHRIDCLPISRDTLGESPVWDDGENAVYWIDSGASRIRKLVPGSGDYREWLMPQMVGSIGLCPGQELLVALADGFYLLDLASGECRPFAAVQHDSNAMRLNDGCCDRSGRFIAGSLVLSGPSKGKLYRLDIQGHVEVLFEDVELANSICFSADGTRMYFADSRKGWVMTCEYDPLGSYVGPATPLVDTRAFGSAPDGATVDSEGGIWVALIAAGSVARFRPNGELDRLVKLPVPYVSSVCFGGADLDILYATTVRDSGFRLRTDEPSAGCVFAVTGLGVTGVRETRFGQR